MRRTFLAMCMLPLLIVITACDEEPTEPKDGNPTLTILNPGAGTELSGMVRVEVFGHDVNNDALDRVVYFVDEVAMYTDPNPAASSPSSVWEWNSETIADGDYDLRVVGYDRLGRSSSAEQDLTVTNADAASGVVRSTEQGTITTRYGASIHVPEGAVPLSEHGQTAAMVFSISRDTTASAAPPPGQTRVSNYYRCTPGGFVFNYPVEVTVPLLDGADVANKEVSLYRINPTTSQLECFAGLYDEFSGTITAQTYELSVWFAAVRTTPGGYSGGWGCIDLENGSADITSLCVESYTLAYPAQDQSYIPELGLHAMSGSSLLGMRESIQLYVPQGLYTICMQQRANDGTWRYQMRTITVTQGSGRVWDGGGSCAANWNGFITDGSIAAPAAGRCHCEPDASVPVGTGEVQITLQWFNTESIDLDLWVYEPSGERCYFGHSQTATGGELDRDNLCGNYENGTPENIFWQTAPVGDYTVWVDWWSDCGNEISQQTFNVRVVNRTSVETFDRTLGRDQTLEVVQFRVLPGGAIQLAPPGGLFVSDPPPHLAKEASHVSR
ncbi:MAG: hypothetical protein H6506_01500 [Calditrichaeota bacterium]|nr:hypothetical protein [Calditrichota bacterium]MCB9367340.1 hypothetical protein [Calditrichota bacterium]MCB9391306.1 hypothetical protein [Calditrichota bacterium]